MWLISKLYFITPEVALAAICTAASELPTIFFKTQDSWLARFSFPPKTTWVTLAPLACLYPVYCFAST